MKLKQVERTIIKLKRLRKKHLNTADFILRLIQAEYDIKYNRLYIWNSKTGRSKKVKNYGKKIK